MGENENIRRTMPVNSFRGFALETLPQRLPGPFGTGSGSEAHTKAEANTARAHADISGEFDISAGPLTLANRAGDGLAECVGRLESGHRTCEVVAMLFVQPSV